MIPTQLLVTIFALAGMFTAAPKQTRTQSGFLFKAIRTDNASLEYVLYVPRAYAREEATGGRTRWPLIVFLHGLGECGTDGQRMMVNGLPQSLLRQPERWPCFVLMPQKPTQDGQWEDYAEPILEAVKACSIGRRIDPDRIALTGLSHGGHGAWALAARHPERWSAVAPVCGRLAPSTAEEIATRVKDLPIWCFHGEKDNVVPASDSKQIIAAIKAAGGKPKLTLYPNANHNAWDPAYGDPALAKWLLSQRRRER